MSEIKRYLEDYKILWETFKKLLNNFYEQTDENKQINEKEIYKHILEYIDALERGDINE